MYRFTNNTLRELEKLMRLAVALSPQGVPSSSDSAERTTPEMLRLWIRSSFTFIEGMTYAFKRFALVVHHENEDSLFSLAEVAMLRDESYDLDDKGEAVIQPKFQRFASNVRFALRALAVASGYPERPDFSGEGWAALRRATLVRNRLTHPRQAEDLEVTTDEALAAYYGCNWFYDEGVRILSYMKQRGLQELARLTGETN